MNACARNRSVGANPLPPCWGALDAQIGLGAAAIGGKDSMSGSFNDLDVPPTLISFAVAPAKAPGLISTDFKSRQPRRVPL